MSDGPSKKEWEEEVAARKELSQYNAKVKAALAEIKAGRLSGAEAARALLPAPLMVLTGFEDRKVIGAALGEDGVRAVLGDQKSTLEALCMVFAAQGDRMGPMVERLGPVAVDVLVDWLAWQKHLAALKGLADPAQPVLLVSVMKALITLSTKAIRELPLATVEAAARLLAEKKAWPEVRKLLVWFPANLDAAGDEVVRAWEANEPGDLELAKTASYGLLRQARRDPTSVEARAREAAERGWVDGAARYLRALLEVTGDPKRALEWLLALIAAGNTDAESAVDTLAWHVLKRGTPEQSEALLRAGRESPGFSARVKDWLAS